MHGMTVESAKEQLRLARVAFEAVGGKFQPSAVSGGVSCEALYGSAAVLMWFAAQAALQGGDYGFYAAASDQMMLAAEAQCG